MKKFLIVFGFMFFMNSTSAYAGCEDTGPTTWCSPPGGGIVTLGNVAYCGIGQCIKYGGSVFCSKVLMGQVVVKGGGVVKCQGGCDRGGRRDLCERM